MADKSDTSAGDRTGPAIAGPPDDQRREAAWARRDRALDRAWRQLGADEAEARARFVAAAEAANAAYRAETGREPPGGFESAR